MVGIVGSGGVFGVAWGFGCGAGEAGELGGGFADGFGVGVGLGVLCCDVGEGLEGAGAGDCEDELGLVVGDGAEVVEGGLSGGCADVVGDLGDGEAGALCDLGGAEHGVEQVLEQEFVHLPALSWPMCAASRENARMSPNERTGAVMRCRLRTEVDVRGSLLGGDGCHAESEEDAGADIGVPLVAVRVRCDFDEVAADDFLAGLGEGVEEE